MLHLISFVNYSNVGNVLGFDGSCYSFLEKNNYIEYQ